MPVNFFSWHSLVNTSVVAGPAVGKGWAKPPNLQWLGFLHLYSSKMPKTLALLSQNKTVCSSLRIPSCQSLSHPSAMPVGTQGSALQGYCQDESRASRYPRTPLTSPFLTPDFPSTEEHPSGKTLTLAETTATSFSIKALILNHVISGFHASKLPLQVELRKSFADESLSIYFSVLKYIFTASEESFAD